MATLLAADPDSSLSEKPFDVTRSDVQILLALRVAATLADCKVDCANVQDLENRTFETLICDVVACVAFNALSRGYVIYRHPVDSGPETGMDHVEVGRGSLRMLPRHAWRYRSQALESFHAFGIA